MAEYAGLPASLKNYLASTDTSGAILSAGLEFNLDDHQTSAMATALRELVIGKIFIKDFPAAISSRLGIDDVKAGGLVNKLVSQSFGPIIEDIKRIQRGKFPDKVMAMQKESQPAGLSPRPSIPEGIKNMPLTQPGARSEVQSVRPMPTPPLQSQPVKPPQPSPQPARPVDLSQVRQAQDRPPISNLPIAPKLPEQPVIKPEPPKPPVQIPPKPPELSPRNLGQVSQNRPQFKIPDLGSLGSAPQDAGQTLRQDQGQATKKSLEEELEKVANVIDLRATSEEK